jgi:hypothetical protein
MENMKNYRFTIFTFVLLFCINSTGFGNKIVFASKDNTVWFEVEKSRDDLLVQSNKFRKRQVFTNKGNNRYINNLGAQIIVVNDETIEYDDPNHRLKFRLYRESVAEVTRIQPSRTSEMNTTQLEGTWASQDLNKKLALVSTRDGFKIKFSGTSNWVHFVYNKDTDLFVDEKGNKYVFNSLTEAEWHSAIDVRKVKISKIANEIEY